MKKITRILALALLVLSLSYKVSAQYVYVVDALSQDSTNLYPYDAKWNDDWVHLGDKLGALPNGTEVTIAYADTVPHLAYFKSLKKKMWSKGNDEYKQDVIAVSYGGTKYLVAAKDLMLSPNDTTGTKDFINKGNNRHTFWGRFYSTLTPYIAIFLLLLAATVLAMLIGKERPRLIPTILVPVCMLLAIALEMVGVFMLGSDVLWWLDRDVIKGGTVIFRLVLFGVAFILQIFSMRLYKNGVIGYVQDPEKKLVVKRPIIGALIGVILLVLSVVAAMIWREDATTCLTVGAILLGLSVLIGIISTAVVNIRAVGLGGGIAFTLFAVIWGIGLVTALVLLIIGFVNVFMEMLITIAGGIVILFFGSKFIPARTYTSGGVTYEVYEDFKLFGK